MLAQGVTNVVTQRAGLPESKRLLPSIPLCTECPVRASLLDDVYALYTDENTQLQQDAQRWLPGEPASYSSADTQSTREAAAVLSRPKPTPEELRPLQRKCQAAT